MTSHPRGSLLCALCATLVFSVSTSFAATINYGDFGPDFPPGVTMYLDVTESSGTDTIPLYGPPSLSGNTLDFNPVNFVATAANGAIDTTDGQLNLDIMVIKGINGQVAGGLTSLTIGERGDYSLLGAGTALTSVYGGVSALVKITEVDGNPIAPIQTFASTSISRDLVTDGPVLLAPWSNTLMVDFAPVLTANNIVYNFGVTKAEVVFNDQLVAISEPQSTGFIAKKDFVLTPDLTDNPGFEIPEPASVLLGAMAVLAFCGMRGRA